MTTPAEEAPSPSIFRVDADDPIPVHVQLARQVRIAVANSKLKPGTPLPSVRGLAQTLGVSANTVARAYKELSNDGIVVGRGGGGTAIAPHEQLDLPALERYREERMETLSRQLVVRALALGLSPDETLEVVRREFVRHGAVLRASGEITPLGQDEGKLLSARNRLVGRIEAIRTGEMLAEVTLVLPAETRLIITVTRSSVERLGLQVGSRAAALVKATEPVLSA